MLELNLKPAFNLARGNAADDGPRRGRLRRCVGAVGADAFAGAAGYITGKAAVLAFIRALDADYKSHGIRCNAILPSVIDTPANREAMPDADHSKWVQPAAIAKVVRASSRRLEPDDGRRDPV